MRARLTPFAVLAAFLGVLLSGAGVLAGEPASAHGEEIVLLREPLLNKMGSFAEHLAALERVCTELPAGAGRRAVAREVGHLRLVLDRMHKTIDRAPVLAEVPGRGPMAEADFDRFVRHLRRAPFSDERLELVRETTVHSLFTSAQVAVIVDTLRFSDAKVEAAVTLHPSVLDPQNFHEVYEVLRFRSDRKKVRERVAAAQAVGREKNPRED